METQEKIKTYADVFGELPRNVRYNLESAVCKALKIKAWDFYRLLAYAFDDTGKYGRGTFFYYFNYFALTLTYDMNESIERASLSFRISYEREYLTQARNEAAIQNRPAPELYPETFLKPHWNATKTATVTRHGVGDTRIRKPLSKKLGRARIFEINVLDNVSLFFRNSKLLYNKDTNIFGRVK